jgi:outer membrane lipoprotein-sorting protein
LKALILGLTMALMAGCGADAPSMSPNAGKNLNGLVISTPDPNANRGIQNPAQDLKVMLSDISARYQRINSISSTIITYDSNGTKTVSSKASACFQKPGKISVQVLEHTDGKAVGTKIVYLGSGQAKVKTKFFGFQVKVNLDLSDGRMCNTRGNTLAETGIVRMMSILLDPNAKTRVLGQGELNGKTLTIVEVISSQSLRGITKELYYIDQQEKIPLVREMYEGNRLVYRSQFNNVVLNGQLPANAFTLD